MKVKIKTWDDMVEEFGIYPSGELIICDRGFTVAMENDMPKDRIIELEQPLPYDPSVWLWKEGRWIITDDMIAEYIDEEEEEENVS